MVSLTPTAASLAAVLLLVCSGFANAQRTAPEIKLSTQTQYTEQMPAMARAEDRRKYWALVQPDAALAQKLAIYEEAQNFVHRKYVAAGFEPAAINARNAEGQLSTFYLDYQDGPFSDANAIAGERFGVQSVWFNHASFAERESEVDNYHTVGHEFFHRIFNPIAQRREHWPSNVPLSRKWMSEGIPTAAAQIALEGFKGTSLARRVSGGEKQAVRSLGAFYLDYPIDQRLDFPIPAEGNWFASSSAEGRAETLSYAVSSFWRHVAAESGGLSGLKHIIDRPRPAGDGAGDWLDWVEDGIQGRKGFANFAEAYNSFVSTFVDYPYLNTTSQSDYFAWGKWQSILFHEGCRQIKLQAGAKPYQHLTTIYPVASKCVRVSVSGGPKTGSVINVVLPNATDQQCSDLNVVSGGDNRYRKAADKDRKRGNKKLFEHPILKPDGSCDWHWVFLHDPLTPNANGEQVFVITNVNPQKPSRTKVARTLTFEFSATALALAASGTVTATTAGSSTAEKKLPVPKKASAKAESLPLLTQPTMESPVPYRGSDCDALSRQIGLCGPYTEIELGFGELADVAIENGLTQVGVMGGDLASLGGLMTQLSGETLLAKASQAIAAGITLKFSRIEPGFVGSFNDAKITLAVSQGDFSSTLESIDPKYIRKGINFECPDVGALYRDNGKVTIESYTASGIAGSFSADFYEPAQSGCPVPLKVATVSGRFSTAPVDDKVLEEYEESPEGQKRMNALLINKFYSMVPPELSFMQGRATTWALFAQQQLAEGAGGGSGGVLAHPAATSGCNCDCKEMLSKLAREGCAKQCSSAFPLMGLTCAMERERDKGNPPGEANRRIERCPRTCAEYRNQSPGELCEVALYLTYSQCGSSDVTAAEIERYLDILVAAFAEPTRSGQRAVMRQQVQAMDAETRNLLVRTTLEAQQ